MDNINIWTTIVDSIGNLLDGIGSIGVFILAYVAAHTSKVNSISINMVKIRPKQYVKVLVFLLLSGVGIWLLNLNSKPSQSQEPLLVFAGGGSVRNYLCEVDSIDVRDQQNSIYVAIASGSAWRVLAEEYQLKKDNLKTFTTICLSAGEMSEKFYNEYMATLDSTIIAEVYLGDDNLVAYVSNGILGKWPDLYKHDLQNYTYTISSKNLSEMIKRVANQTIEINDKIKKVRIFTTSTTSGTLESYKMSLNNYIDLEKMRDTCNFSNYYENTDPKIVTTYNDNNTNIDCGNEFIILGSRFYKVIHLSKDLYKPLYLIDSDEKEIQKPMYLYFLATRTANNYNHYKINENILEFLNKLNMSAKSHQSKKSKWDSIIKSGIIEYNLSNEQTKYIKRIN